MMKKKHQSIALIFLGMILSTAVVFAQESPEKKFVFNSEKVKLSNFFVEIAPGTNFAKINDQLVSISAFSAGFILNEKFSVAFFSANSPKVNLLAVPVPGSQEYADWVEAGVDLDKLSSSTEFVYANFRHAGLQLSYLHRTDRMLFWRAGLSAGFLGGMSLSENKSFMGLFNNSIYNEPVISLNPEVGLGINLLIWWRVHVDFGYRLLGVDERVMEAADSDSFSFSFGFAFGKFGK
jgi:hypothetical protein